MGRREFDKNGNQNVFRNNVLGARDLEDLADAFDEDFKVKVNAFIDGEDFCDAVRRCLINDLIAGAMDERDDNRRKKRH
jgi:hypothetical protein